MNDYFAFICLVGMAATLFGVWKSEHPHTLGWLLLNLLCLAGWLHYA